MKKVNFHKSLFKEKIAGLFIVAALLTLFAFKIGKGGKADSLNAPYFDCLSQQIIHSLGIPDAVGVDQATLTVRSDGSYDFGVHYCCNKRPSNNSISKGRGSLCTSPGCTKHAEWSINSQTGCLELKVIQKY